jgi:tryptophan synthase alpha chain
MTLKETLEKKQQGLLNIYCTAGYPAIDDLPHIVNALHEAGVDMVEIGIPYSDPIADGPTIQESNKIALDNGISMEKIFNQLELCTPEIPKILMGYFNPVLQFGMERFCKRAKECGVDAVILPDLPVELYEERYKELFEEHKISFIFLITPQTTAERIKKIASLSSSFIYAVSSSSTTGKAKGLDSSKDYLERLKHLDTGCPILVGFNISTPEDLAFVHQYANGGIIGSRFIRWLKDKKDVAAASKEFVTYITEKQTKQ